MIQDEARAYISFQHSDETNVNSILICGDHFSSKLTINVVTLLCVADIFVSPHMDFVVNPKTADVS